MYVKKSLQLSQEVSDFWDRVAAVVAPRPESGGGNVTAMLRVAVRLLAAKYGVEEENNGTH